ncbi:MAG: LTA synthase family protein [Lachnospiraceae bacterium]|nr:LTA synthase family protein [Lachnospiraceae bacterium]
MNPYSLLLTASCVFTFALLMLLDVLIVKRKRKKNGESAKLPVSFFVAHGFTYLAFMLGTALLTATYWMKANFNETDLATLFFHMHVKITSNDIQNFKGLYLWLSLCIFAGSLILWLLGKLGAFLLNRGPKGWRIAYIVIRNIIIVAYPVIAICVICSHFNVIPYIKQRLDTTKIYDDYYVDPKTAKVTFPEKKRNLIYIYLESVENSYADPAHGGVSEDNLIPELTELSLKYENFGDRGSNILHGPTPVSQNAWTMASLVGQTSGIPINFGFDSVIMQEGVNEYLPGAFNLGDMLKREGYDLCYLIGSISSFAAMDVYMRTHGDYEIRDYNYYHDKGLIDYFVWWGFEDYKVFEFAKDYLVEASASDQPFALTLMTMDTHFTNGYKCEYCEDVYTNQYSNVIACSSRMVSSFVKWVQEQPFYENTTIVVIGDHPTMDTAYYNGLKYSSKDYVRRNYIAVINSAVENPSDVARNYQVIDMYPTTIAALGATIEGDRLGLGTNLYSLTPTLYEELGKEYFDKEIMKNSRYYNDKLADFD